MVRVRPATPADAPAMHALHTAAVRELGAATHDGDVAGFGQLNVPDQEVVADYVHPDHARQGVGSTLLVHLEGYARGLGFQRLTLTASMNAVGFYEHHGSEVVEETELDRSHRVDGVVLPVAVMEKPLP